jgi:hypothetical protein
MSGTVWVVSYLERKRILRKLYEKRGAERHDALMEMCERMGWKGREVMEWQTSRYEVEMQGGVNRGLRE